MTVAAVILAASVESALADAAGVPRIRRIADAAWSGGALPIVVVAPDPDGAVATALSGAPVTLVSPVPVNGGLADGGPAVQILRGMEIAAAEVSGTSAALIWPARLCWVGPETITSLVEAHGTDTGAVVRAAFHGESGWPALIPLEAVDALGALPPAAMPDQVIEWLAAGGGVQARDIELGDPGAVFDGATARDDLPAYEGPAEPSGVHAHEWGEAIASSVDETASEGAASEAHGPGRSI